MPETPEEQVRDRRAAVRRAGHKRFRRRQWMNLTAYAILIAGNALGLAKSFDVANTYRDDSERKQASIAKLALQAKYDAAFQDYAQCLRGNEFRDTIVMAISNSLSAALKSAVPPQPDATASIKRVQRSVDDQLEAVTATKRQCIEPKVPAGVNRRYVKVSAKSRGGKDTP